MDVPSDPFGLENEFREGGPLKTSEDRPSDDRQSEHPLKEKSRTERRSRERDKAKTKRNRQRTDTDGKNDHEENQLDRDLSITGRLNWDISLDLPSGERRAWIKMLEKHRKAFAGPEGRLGKVIAKYDMTIDADTKAIKSQQLYRTSPRKRKLINDVVEKLCKMEVIQPSTSEIASPAGLRTSRARVARCKPRLSTDS